MSNEFSNHENTARPVQYHKPEKKTIEKLAHRTCRELGDRYDSFTLENGLIDLLEIAATIGTERANSCDGELSEAA